MVLLRTIGHNQNEIDMKSTELRIGNWIQTKQTEKLKNDYLIGEYELDEFIEKLNTLQDNELRKALIDVQSLILNRDNYTYGAFNEMDHVKGILEKALN